MIKKSYRIKDKEKRSDFDIVKDILTKWIIYKYSQEPNEIKSF